MQTTFVDNVPECKQIQYIKDKESGFLLFYWKSKIVVVWEHSVCYKEDCIL